MAVARQIKLCNKKIGPDYPCFIIAEAGINHNGRLDLALKLVEAAAEAGADAVKFQTFKAEQVVTQKAKLASYQKAHLGRQQSQFELLKKLELTEEFYGPIIKRCKEKNILFLSTPHGGRESVEFLESIGVGAYKIGSGDLTNYILLEKVAKTGKPIILSTGMTTFSEVKDAVSFIRSQGNSQIVVLHCTTNYPCALSEVNLGAMVTMMKKLDVPVGYSDHTVDNQVAVMAATLGAAIYECHFTLDKALPGPDHAASVNQDELQAKIKAIRRVRIIMGKSVKKPTKSEAKEMIPLIRKSLVLTRDFPKDHVLTLADLEAKRPGLGVSPTKYGKFLGKKLKRAMKMDELLNFKDVRRP